MTREQQAATLALDQLAKLNVTEAGAQASTSKKTEFTLEGGRFTLLRTTLDHSLSLQAIMEQRRGTVSGNSFEPEAVEGLARDAAAGAQAAQPDPAWEIAREGQGEFIEENTEPDLDRLFERTQEMVDEIHKAYPKIILEQVIASHTQREGCYLNSHGVKYLTKTGGYGVFVMFSGHEGDKSSSFNYTGFETAGLGRPFLEMATLRQSLEDAEKQIHTQATEGKFEGTVIFTPDCLGGMLYELISNYASDGVLLDGTSLWKDALETRVADPGLTIRVAPSDPCVVNGEKYTGEGFLSEDYDFIRDGVFKQFMVSAYAANKTGKKRAPNASYSLIMAPGQQALSEIVASVKKGLLVSRYSGGAAGTGGEFSGVAKNSFLIRDGKIGPAVSETMISGNLAKMLKQVRGISKETVEDGSGRLPWLAVDGITISGK